MTHELGDPTPFDILDPLPDGRSTTILEASAGTGKTFTVGALVTRYVAEGMATLDEMLVITFGRAASQELRERVREQLVAAERALSDPATVGPDDVLLTHLVSADIPLRHKRISDALAGFDGATIATTHQFCQLVLRSLGVAGDTDSRAELVDNLDELVVEVTDDLYLAAVRLATQTRRRSSAPSRCSWPGQRSATRRQSSHRRTPSPGARRGPRSTSPKRCATRWSGASTAAASCRTTTCSAGSPTRSRTSTHPHAIGCASAGRWSWSTSSRTPTRCSGTSSTGPSPATRR